MHVPTRLRSTPQKWDVSPDGMLDSVRDAFHLFPTSHRRQGWRRSMDRAPRKLSSSTSFRAEVVPRADPRWSRPGTARRTSASRTVRPDGSAYRSISNFAENHESPSWSTDGAAIVFESSHTGIRQIWAMNADRTGRRARTAGTRDQVRAHSSVRSPVRSASCLAVSRSARANLPLLSSRAAGTLESPPLPPSACRVARGGAGSRLVCSP